jgi:phosphoesterase RecJ-like protein
LNGIVTDTIGFRTTNVKPATLIITANLIRLGANLSSVYHKGISERSFIGARYWGIGLSKLKKQHGIVWTSLTLEERRKVGYRGGDDADLINLLSSIKDAKIAVIFIEQHQGRVKISWRICGPEKSDLDVSQIALEFGGGGHKSAAGAMVEGSLGEVQEKVLNRTKSII